MSRNISINNEQGVAVFTEQADILRGAICHLDNQMACIERLATCGAL